jgi:hypothetical protein
VADLGVALIVEGYGEVEAAPILLRRLAREIAPHIFLRIERPYRVSRVSIVKDGELERYVELAGRQVGADGCVLVLLDADDDCAATLGPQLLARCEAQRPHTCVGVCLAVSEFEAWFLAAAESIAGHRGLPEDLASPGSPEGIRGAKGWLKRSRTDGRSYSETIDQPALTSVFDMYQARGRSASFDKMWREVERLLACASGARAVSGDTSDETA